MQEKPWYKSWPEEVPKTIAYREVPLPKILYEKAEERAGRPLIIHEDGRRLSYAQVVEHSKRISAALWDAGVRRGEHTPGH
jgi:long-chain acyl-CoA synthetase